MSEDTPTLNQNEQRNEAASLRKALGQVRRDAEQEVARINRRLRERSAAAEDAAASAAERLALQQERDSLQQMLSARESALATITEECRRLEDVLEDQHLVFDDLRREVAQRDDSLRMAQDEVERLRNAVRDLQSQAPAVSPGQREVGARGGHAARSRLRPHWKILAGVLSVMGAGAVGYYWFDSVSQDPAGAPAVSRETGPLDRREPALNGPEDRFDPNVAEPDPEGLTSPSVAAQAAATQPILRHDPLPDGSTGPALVVLTGGTFRMGHTLATANDFGPVREVQLAPFLIGAYEVTFDEFDRFARATGRGLPEDQGWGRGTRPVVGVSWDEAQDYLGWLSRETGLRYRLPSEAEWEFAARAGQRGSYWWGFGLEPGRALCFDCGSEWDNRSSAPVGSFPPNPFGLYDTAGNVLEWVADCYEADYRAAPVDGSAYLSPSCARRVARGGAFNKPAASMRVYVREQFIADTRLNFLGFRVARDL